MKSGITNPVLIAITVTALSLAGCKKDNTSPTALPSSQQNLVQNSDVQDAISDKNEQEIDNTLDQLQVSNYSTSSLKDALLTGTRSITVDHPDSTTFPKVITIVYNNYKDSTATESFVKNGEIDVTVTAQPGNKQYVTRVQTFKDFSITTDSTTVTINGTRTVTRANIGYKFTALSSLRIVLTDNITADLSYAITKTGTSDSLKFTRVVEKTRKAFLHYSNSGGNSWLTIKFKNVAAKDTVTWSGSITGVDEKGDTYAKSVAAGDPVTMIDYNGTPVLISGTLDLTVQETTPLAYTVTFKEDPSHPHLTLVTVTNNATGTSHSFDRRIGRKFVKWW